MAVDTIFPPDSPEATFLSREIDRQVQELQAGAHAAAAKKAELQASQDAQEESAQVFIKNAAPQTVPSSPQGFLRKLFKGERP